MQDFAGKVAVITGAGRGIGRGIALRCAEEGMKVVLAGYGLESITKTAADLHALGAATLVVQTDVSQPEAVARLAEASFAAFGQVDLLVNNAGVTLRSSVVESTLDDWHWVMGVNFFGVLHGVQAFVPRMAQQAGVGHVVNVASLSGLVPGGGLYGVSKHAVVVLTESLYHELAVTAPHVKVSVYCPGWVSTELDTVDRSRPPRFSRNATAMTDAQRADFRAALQGGLSIEESAEILFAGLRQEKLYIGVQAFNTLHPEVPAVLRTRVEDIINERSPAH